MSVLPSGLRRLPWRRRPTGALSSCRRSASRYQRRRSFLPAARHSRPGPVAPDRIAHRDDDAGLVLECVGVALEESVEERLLQLESESRDKKCVKWSPECTRSHLSLLATPLNPSMLPRRCKPAPAQLPTDRVGRRSARGSAFVGRNRRHRRASPTCRRTSTRDWRRAREAAARADGRAARHRVPKRARVAMLIGEDLPLVPVRHEHGGRDAAVIAPMSG